MATHSSILAWRITWTEEPDGLQSIGSQESDTTELLILSLSISIDDQIMVPWSPTSIPAVSVLSCQA